jgi:hypothetical protein
VTGAQESALRRALQLGSLHDINAAIGLLRDLEAAEPVPLPLAVMRYVLQEIDHRFEGQALPWRSGAGSGSSRPSALCSIR